MIEVRESSERTLEEAVSRALRDNLGPLQRNAIELEQAFDDFVAACSSAKPGNALPAMLRAQAFAASLSASLSVLSNFAAIALSTDGRSAVAERHVPAPQAASAPAVAPIHTPVQAPLQAPHHQAQEHPPAIEAQAEIAPVPTVASFEREDYVPQAEIPVGESQPEVPVFSAPEPAAAAEPAFDISSFPAEIQDLHRRANRVAKVAMQDIKLLRPQDVQSGREHKDICDRLRSDLDKARKEYDRRFRAIQDHPVDYFHRWMVEILAQGDEQALGEYPYPSPVLRH